MSVRMQHKIVTVTLIFIDDMFPPYSAIIRYPRYAELFTALLVSILKLKLKLRLKFKLNRSHKEIESVFTKFNSASDFNFNFKIETSSAVNRLFFFQWLFQPIRAQASYSVP
jgi:hypothetical protein